MLGRRTFLQGTMLAVAAAMPTPPPAAAVGPQDSADGLLAWPPVSADTRPWTRWWWLGSGVTTAGLVQHLRRLQQAGLGGVEIQPIYEAQGYEDRVLEYLSPAWLDALDATTSYATRLGMGVDLTSGSGWNFGGPWISPELSAGRALLERWQLRGGQRLEEPVRTSQPGHPRLVDEERLSRPDLRPPMDPLPEPPLSALVAREAASGDTVDLTAHVAEDGTLDWTAPAGTWELTAVFAGLVLKRVERAGPGGKGLMADYFGGTGVQRHLDVLDAALGPGRRGLRASFHDSFELEATDWSRSFLDDFAKLRGYDLRPYLPDLFAEGSTSETTARVTTDVRHTFSELFVERFAEPWARWSESHGWLTRNQAHGSPANLLDVNGACDIPETEYTGAEILPIPGLRQGFGAAQPPKSLIWRMASSPAHVNGKRLVAAETITWRDEHYHVSLSQAKPAVDLLFAAGVNHIVFHGTTYSPQDVAWPGFSFYAATEVNPTNTLWRDLPELTSYITRCQSILQDGTHGNDVLVYWPQFDLWATPDAGLGGGAEEIELTPDYKWQGTPWMYGNPHGPGALVTEIEERGWQLDWVSDRQLLQFSGRPGAIYNDHTAYSVVVVPAARLMPLQTLQQLRDLAAGGGTVVFVDRFPTDVPGMGDLAARRRRFEELLAELTSRPVRGRRDEYRIGRGRVVLATQGEQLDSALVAAGATREPMADLGLRVLRRRHEEGWHYFVANVGAETVSDWCPLGVAAASVAVLDPLLDRRGRAEARRSGGHTLYRLHLEPGQSLILRTFDDRPIAGQTVAPLVPGPRTKAITGPWELTFLEGGPRLPASRTLNTLVSWPQLGSAEEAFSGTARYRTTVTLTAREANADWLLDLGDVRESARVIVNGTPVGTAWALPFRLPLAQVLQVGENVLEIEVTNLAANRVRALAQRGQLTIPHYMSWRSRRPPAEWAPVPSGLLGEIRLVEVLP